MGKPCNHKPQEMYSKEKQTARKTLPSCFTNICRINGKAKEEEEEEGWAKVG